MTFLFQLPTLASIFSATSTNTMVTTRSATRARSRLAELPTELLLQIFQSLTSFRAATNLAATSRQFQDVWRQYLTPIYEAIAPTYIIGHSALRELLVNLGYIPPNTTTVSLDYVSRVVEGAKIGDVLVDAYHAETEINLHHDPQISTPLSPTEKRRFVRGMYQILGLLCLDLDKQDEHIRQLSLKDLFLLSDFLCVLYPPATMDEKLRNMLYDDPYAPHDLQRRLRSHRNMQFRELYDHRYRPIKDIPYQQGGRQAWWCDRQQQAFKDMLTGRVYRERAEKGEMSKVREDLWYDSGEE